MRANSTEALNDSHDQKLDQILAGVQKLDARIQRLEADGPDLRTRLELIETRVDERLRETRPIWDSVHTQLTELRESLLTEGQSRQAQVAELKESMEAQIGEVKESQQCLRSEMEKSFRLLDRRMEMFADMVARVHAYERDLEDRVDELAKRLA